MRCRVATVVKAFVYFAIGDEANCKSLRSKISYECCRLGTSFQSIGHPVAIYQIAHRSTRGRGGMLRLSYMFLISASVSISLQEPKDDKNAS